MEGKKEDKTTQEIIRSFGEGMSIRAVAKRFKKGRETVRKLLEKEGRVEQIPHCPQGSKLDPFRGKVEELAKEGLGSPRILREIKELGYTGERTILVNLLREIRPPATIKKAFRRFETPAGKEGQADWSPYRIEIADRTQLAHAFSVCLCHSRKLHIRFYRDEKLPTLLFALEQAFLDFQGVPRQVYFDNMATVTFGRSKGKPIWNDRFLDLSKHYMFEPRLCRVRDPNRKGKVERAFHFLEHDFLRGRKFASWAELNAEVATWLTEIANRRVHGTTRRVPDEVWEEERSLLIKLPDQPFGSYRQEIRKVGVDGLLSFDGVRYSVPSHLARTQVTVRATPTDIEILDALGQRVATHRLSEDPSKLVINPDHQPPRERVSREKLEDGILRCFPGAADFIDGLRKKAGPLAHLHLRKLRQLATQYADSDVLAAIAWATELRRFSAHAVARLLERSKPETFDPPLPMGTAAAVLGAIEEDDDWIDVTPYDHIETSEPTVWDENEKREEVTGNQEDDDAEAVAV